MKKLLLLFLIMLSFKCVSQLYFSTNATMYVKNQVLYVDQNINLSTNSNLYLRNNSQLIQGTSTISTNSGAGTLSLYQEGTSDNYDYNYWCSPVGTSSASSGNDNFGITMLSRPTTSTASTAAVALPNSSLDGTANPLAIASRWIYKLSNANSYSQWIYVGNNTTIAPGEGFTMKGTSGTDTTDPEGTGITNNPGGTGAQRYDFRGKPNDGNITVSVSTNNSTLTGNPYPSALHLNAFLLDPSNNAASGIAYFWEQDKTVNSHYLADYRAGYGAYSPISLASDGIYVPATFNSYNGDGSLNTTGASSGLSIERKYSPIGQGFIIQGTANGTVTLKNSHRTFYKEGTGFSQFEKNTNSDKAKRSNREASEEVSHFKLNVIINNQFTRQLALAFVPEATDNVDLGIDALNLSEMPNDVNFLINNQNYIIQGINFDKSKIVPLRTKTAASTTLKFYILEVINFDPSQNIFIYDALDQSYHNIKDAPYEVIVPKGSNNDRFKIVFKNNNILDTNEEIKNTFLMSYNRENQTLTAHNPDNINLKTFALYDILGRVILTEKNLGANATYNFSTSILNSGIYIAQFLTVDNKKITQKVSISNSEK